MRRMFFPPTPGGGGEFVPAEHVVMEMTCQLEQVRLNPQPYTGGGGEDVSAGGGGDLHRRGKRG